MKEITKAIIKVMQEVKGMEKNSRVGTGNSSYDGTKDQDVKMVFNKALSDNGLCMVPIDIDEETKVERWQEKTDWGLKQKQSIFTKVKVKFSLMHISGESQTITGYGHGIDSQDKGAGKATTYAMKNALLYTFCTPVGKMDDTETTHSEAIPVPQKAPKPMAWLALFNKDESETPAYKKLEAAIADGQNFTLASIKTKYRVSEAVEKQLLHEFSIK